MRFSTLLRALALLPLIAVGGCSGADLVNVVTPRSGYTLRADIPYGPQPRQRLDLYTPETAGAGLPAVVFFYGGNWETGAKGDYRFVAQALAARGYRVVVPDYRLYPEVRFPAFLEDAAAAVAWARREAGGPVALLGHSAGAYNAVMLTVDGRWLRGAGLEPCDAVAATVGLAGPYDFLPLTSRNLMDIFGPEETRVATQPITHVDGKAPPLLLLTGDEDTTVRPRNSERMAARIRERGGTVKTGVYEGIGHIQIVAAFAAPLRGLAPVVEDVDAFLRGAGNGSCG